MNNEQKRSKKARALKEEAINYVNQLTDLDSADPSMVGSASVCVFLATALVLLIEEMEQLNAEIKTIRMNVVDISVDLEDRNQ